MFLLAWLFVTPLASANDAAAQQVFRPPTPQSAHWLRADKADDMKALSSILGPDSAQILSSGDPVADKNARDEFVRRYNEMHRLAYDDQVASSSISALKLAGSDPMVKKDNGWVFDTAAGKDELLYRRIGRNELFTIKVLEILVDAQSEYASQGHDGGSEASSRRNSWSDTGKQNGLYWGNCRRSARESYRTTRREGDRGGLQEGQWRQSYSFSRYYYKILTGQGRNAPGGAKEVLRRWQDDEWIRLSSLSAEYRASGVMTLMINQDGVIIQKDLGPDTVKLCKHDLRVHSDKTWQEVDE